MTRIALLNNTNDLQGDRGRERVETTDSNHWSDVLLVQRCAQHDPAAMREIVRRYQEKLYRFLSQLLGTHEDTEEAVLDVFLRVWQHAGRFEGRASFATWLYRIATNVAYDRLRQKKRQRQTAAASLDDWSATSRNAEDVALNNLEREERSQQLQMALQSLRADDRLLLLLYYSEDLGYEEIREITGYPNPVLKMRLMRARRRLRAVMDTLATEVIE